jgi:hypothetical protein
MHDDELTDPERRAIGALPRERAPRHALEDRVVAALRREGLLHRPPPLQLPLTPAWIGAAVAASVALFVGGFTIGGWIESRHTTNLLAQMHEHEAANASVAAAAVQRTGSAYVAALAALAAVADTSRGESVTQGREVAVNAMHAVASQMVRLAPEDPLAVRILQGFDRTAHRDSSDARRTMWF